jgi:hypothetical protein
MFPTCPTPPLKKYINLKGLPNTNFSCMRCHWHRMHDFCVRKSILYRRILSRIQNLARESGAQGVLFDEKTEGRKSRDTVPLNWAPCNHGANTAQTEHSSAEPSFLVEPHIILLSQVSSPPQLHSTKLTTVRWVGWMNGNVKLDITKIFEFRLWGATVKWKGYISAFPVKFEELAMTLM